MESVQGRGTVGMYFPPSAKAISRYRYTPL
jgi:hypothetical protein